jgi:uracil-DNA glycosylase
VTFRFVGAFDTILVGEAPSASSDPWNPLSGMTGRRLRQWLGRDPATVFCLANLLDRWPGKGRKGSRFPLALAKRRARAAARVMALRGMPGRLVFVGARVASAFGFRRMEPLKWRRATLGGRRVDVALLPHPSGCNMYYNRRANVESAARFLKKEARR